MKDDCSLGTKLRDCQLLTNDIAHYTIRIITMLGDSWERERDPSSVDPMDTKKSIIETYIEINLLVLWSVVTVICHRKF